MLSVNIQSLNSKFNALDSLIADLIKNNVDLSLLALQEIWQVDHPDLFEINGYNLCQSIKKSVLRNFVCHTNILTNRFLL